MSEFSDYIVYLDESGSPSIEADAQDFPVFVLACVCISKEEYANAIVPRLQALKFKYFGHDQIVFHERDIRRQSGDFVVFRGNPDTRSNFLADVSRLIGSFDFDLATAVIDKAKLAARYPNPWSPYELAMLLAMEHLALILRDKGQLGRIVHVVAESRGKLENAELELSFRRIADGQPPLQSNQIDLITSIEWRLLFSDKKSNSSGLQLADLIARPVGKHHLKPHQENRAYDIIKKKIGYWVKKFP
ncbi:3-deoxy-D-manno-octulosonic acid transferase [Roseobacter cerasinus]|uniref:3-deoxy-D-manno-octulosonic acid transferase n=1 Tax=Roseobacter cerasinus TaxID=2602289 RepID=A0A640VYR6_9RHOB|nr:DUF3800 domain-containing protein [Roseobacter cerasinus]GFE52251.1 3-deoxy-D-manno-octulosonic acid transferase [Roseobacter cerasinus]